MPRGQKSKRGAQEKCHQARSESQLLKGDQASAAEAEESLLSPLPGDSLLSTPALGPFQEPQGASAASSSEALGPSQEPQGASAASSPEEGASCPRSDEAAKSQGEEGACASHAATFALMVRKDPLNRRVSKLEQYLMEKLRRKEPITQAAMQRIVNRQYEEQFPEILSRASDRLELLYGLDLKPLNPNNHTYILINNLGLQIDGALAYDKVFPETGLLRAILGFIFKKGHFATEDEILEFLDGLGIHPGKRHILVGDPRAFICKDLVQQQYLEYNQVPTDPPCYVYLWGPKAYFEVSKMKTLEALAKIKDKIPSAFSNLFSQVLKIEEDRAWFTAAAMIATIDKCSVTCRVKCTNCSKI